MTLLICFEYETLNGTLNNILSNTFDVTLMILLVCVCTFSLCNILDNIFLCLIEFEENEYSSVNSNFGPLCMEL